MAKKKEQATIKTNWEDVIKASVKGNPKPKNKTKTMNTNDAAKEITNALIQRFPSLLNNVVINVHVLDGKAREVLYKLPSEMGAKEKEALNIIIEKAEELGIPIVTELNQ